MNTQPWRLFILRVTILCLSVAAPLVASADGGFQAGASTSNITPEIGGKIIGGFVPFPSTHVHDELHARCIVLDDGQVRLALVVCDLLGIDRSVSDEARRLIAERHEIPRERILISATHTHSAVSALGTDSRSLQQTPDPYQQFVARRIADGVSRAVNNLRPAEMAFGTAEAPEHVNNRRWHMKPGTVPLNPFGEVDAVKMNPPRGNGNLVKPAGPTDPTVSFLAFREPNGRPIALYASYSLHYVGGVGSGHVSADYFAVFSEQLKESLASDPHQEYPKDPDAPPFVAMMANGTSGDINNIDFVNARPRKKRYEQMRYVGTDVAAKVYDAMAKLKYQNEVKLAAAYREPTIAWREVSEQRKKWAEETIAAGKQKERDLSYIYAQRTLRQAKYPSSTTTPLQVFRIGDVCIGTMPFEIFCEIGLEFKKRSPLQPAFLVSLAHGYFGYLPTPRQHRLGGYETWLGTNRVELGASDKLLDALLEMAADLESQ